MRNLKRALSLTLASVMLLGMMVIGTSAASYPDVDKDNNVEAIEVLQAVGVMQGDDRGNFDPDRSVSRNEMAIIMAKLLDLDYNYYQNTCPFYDVPDYAKPYVAACYANGIVSGYNATQYGGADTVTAVQAASMMMRALGYFKYDSDYKDGFVLATVSQASRLQLFDGINANQDTPLTRDQVAKLALNTLETTMVDAEDNTLNISGSSGDMNMSVTGGQVNYIVRTSTRSFAQAIDKSESQANNSTTGTTGFTIELGEQLYNGDLKKNETTSDFGAPATRWSYKVDEIGVYDDDTILVSTKKVTIGELYNLIGSANVNNLTGKDDDLESGDRNQLVVYQDGEIVSVDGKPGVKTYFDRNSSNGALSGKGVLTKVYQDNDNNVTITYVNTYVAQATSDYSSSKGSVNVSLLTRPTDGSYSGTWSNFNSLADDDFDVQDIKQDDYILYTYAKGQVQTIERAEVVSGEVTAYSVSTGKAFGDAGGNVSIGGEQHDYAKYAEVDAENGCAVVYTVGIDAAVVVDKDGFVYYVDDFSASSGNYVYIDAAAKGSALSEDVLADAYFNDGRNEDIRVNKITIGGTEVNLGLASPTRADNIGGTPIRGWYRYTRNSSDKYTLTRAATSGSIAYDAATIDTNRVSLGGGFTANSNTVYIVKDEDNDITVYTGVAAAPELAFSSDGYVYAVKDKDDRAKSVASLVFADVGSNGNVRGNTQDSLFYLLKLDTTYVDNRDGENVYRWIVVKDGVEEKVETKEDWKSLYTEASPNVFMLEDYRQDPDGYYEGGSLFDVPDDADKFTDALTDATISQSGDTLTIGSRTVVITGDTKISLILKPSEAKSRASVLRDQVMTDWSADYEVVEGASASSIAADLKNFDITGELYTVYGDKNKSDVADHIYLVVTSVKNSDTTRPTITSQPAAAAYEKGATPTALTVAAAAGAGGALSYQWQSSTDGSNWSNIANATAASYTPSTAAVGTTYYRVVVTEDQSGSNVTVTSDAAAVVVIAPLADAPTAAYPADLGDYPTSGTNDEKAAWNRTVITTVQGLPTGQIKPDNNLVTVLGDSAPADQVNVIRVDVPGTGSRDWQVKFYDGSGTLLGTEDHNTTGSVGQVLYFTNTSTEITFTGNTVYRADILMGGEVIQSSYFVTHA